MKNKRQELRIIGGNYRRRVIMFPDLPGLRPTPNRLRETLFNWLFHDLEGAVCLDAFAGSGALGFEALSRGAKQVVFVDQSREVIDAIRQNAQKLGVDAARYLCVCGDVLGYLRSCQVVFDGAFLDPPYEQNQLPELLSCLDSGPCLSAEAWVYLEAEKSFSLDSLETSWQWLKEKTTKRIRYGLIYPSVEG